MAFTEHARNGKQVTEVGRLFLKLLSESSPDLLQEYLSECLDFLESLTSAPTFLYLPIETKAKLEITLVNALSVSQLKVSMSCLSAITAAKLGTISSNLLAATTAKEQAHSPLMFALIKF
jgi:hypothetical protein